MKSKTSPECKPCWRLLLYAIVLHLTVLPWFLLFIRHAVIANRTISFSCLLFFLSSLLAYPALWNLPSIGAAALGFCLFKKPLARLIFTAMAGAFASLAGLYLIGDYIMLLKYGYHFNGLVFNLLVTPGGFESMGLDALSITCCCLAFALYILLQMMLTFTCYQAQWTGRLATALARHWHLPTLLPAIVSLALVISLLSTGVADFRADASVMANVDMFPGLITIRMRKLMRSLGFQDPPREDIQLLSRHNLHADALNYPQKSIQRQPDHRKYNVIWLVAESLRADLLTDEIMPNTWQFAKSCHRFLNHYSGGRGTRPGMFSMFYGLYATNWFSFLGQRRGPLVLDWMHEDNAQFLCQTSAKFTYPEFDQTIFVTMKQEQLREHSKGFPPDRDVLLTDQMLSFIAERDTSRPFFAFGFFESTHAPYSFPPDKIIRKNYLEHINYATVSPKDATMLFNRDANAAYHVDSQFARILQMVMADEELRNNTIIIITGDHGEEFFENGRLGHNSAFVQQQIHVPLVFYHPGTQAAVHDQITHHTDLVPTLATLFGVQNPPQDFSVGQDLLSPNYHRDFFIVCGWDEVAFVNQTHKYILPVGSAGAIFRREVTTLDDQPVNESKKSKFFKQFASQLQAAQKDMTRFVH
ncbi:MAG: sulfatase-like hydrolase/transferase [Victivallales bacterium]|nr:sulfatase-like hydrolase/transferase [Victivallales bacterium]